MKVNLVFWNIKKELLRVEEHVPALEGGLPHLSDAFSLLQWQKTPDHRVTNIIAWRRFH
jgi:hypothetical protein